MSPPAIPGTRIHVLAGQHRPVIINQSSLIHRPTRAALAGMSALLWAGWASFWVPAAAVLAPEAGVGLTSFLSVLPKYSFFISLMSAVFLGWAGFNWLRFAQKERRTARPPVTNEALAEHFGVDPDELALHRGGNRIEISYSSEGRIVGISSSRRELG